MKEGEGDVREKEKERERTKTNPENMAVISGENGENERFRKAAWPKQTSGWISEGKTFSGWLMFPLLICYYFHCQEAKPQWYSSDPAHLYCTRWLWFFILFFFKWRESVYLSVDSRWERSEPCCCAHSITFTAGGLTGTVLSVCPFPHCQSLGLDIDTLFTTLTTSTLVHYPVFQPTSTYMSQRISKMIDRWCFEDCLRHVLICVISF